MMTVENDLMKGESALVVFSGGQDSTTCLYWAKSHFLHVRALSFTYGQKHALEVQLAEQLSADADVAWESMDVSFISQLSQGCCSLTDESLSIENQKASDAKSTGGKQPAKPLSGGRQSSRTFTGGTQSAGRR